MNRQEKDILLTIFNQKTINQRHLSDLSGHSLGIVNRSIKNLKEKKYINENFELTTKCIKELKKNKPKNAIILAAGFGLRMLPVNMELPKAFLEVKNSILIERLICQLKEKNINDIYIVVGYNREKFDYLIDKYQVKLIINTKYAEKNNAYSLYLASKFIDNSYILPCDIYFEKNPFSNFELYSWYLVDNIKDKTNTDIVYINKKLEILRNSRYLDKKKALGVAYILKEDKEELINKLDEFCKNSMYNNLFWEESLYKKEKMILLAKILRGNIAYEINNFDDLVNTDENSKNLNIEVLCKIKKIFKISIKEIKNMKILKKGISNITFSFEVNFHRYVMKIPREDSVRLLYKKSRKIEKKIYHCLKEKNLTEEIIYIDSNTGLKISRYIEDSHHCDKNNFLDVERAIKSLKKLHNWKIKVGLEFDIFKTIDFYEKIWGKKSAYPDYEITKTKLFSLKDFITDNIEEKILSHLDAVYDNFLIDKKGNVRLIDWEDSKIADPHIDIAMFCIFSLYDKEKIDKVINIYFEGNCNKNIRLKIYAYIAICGLLWSNWCEYKRNIGIEFGEYAMKQYRYAKEFYNIFQQELGRANGN